MKDKIIKVIEAIFSISLLVALLGGGIIFLMFLVAIVMGGTAGEALAVSASKVIMPYFIRLASIAVLCGLITFYITGKHTLSLDDIKN